MNIGNEIKRLRTRKMLSQAELAEVLHVTAQSVSKWENDTSYPDISQLPAIASFFGITIDELFVYPTKLEYERIEKAIENGNTLSNEQFVHCEGFLLDEIRRDPENHKAVSMLGDLYHFHACRLNEKAIHYAMEALNLKPDNKFDLNTLNNASNGCINDWNVACNAKLIDRLLQLIQQKSENNRTKLYLLDNLIADGRVEEAEQILNENPDIKLAPIYHLWIKERVNGFGAVESEYVNLLQNDAVTWEILMEAANRLAFNQKYDGAIGAYEKAFEKCPKPRFTDMLASIAWLNRLKGDKQAAIHAYKRELQLLKDEWNITKGEQVETIKDHIIQLG